MLEGYSDLRQLELSSAKCPGGKMTRIQTRKQWDGKSRLKTAILVDVDGTLAGAYRETLDADPIDRW